MTTSTCAICNHEDREAIEAVGKQCLDGLLSWRKGAEQTPVRSHQPLKNHMERHYVAPVDRIRRDSEPEIEAKFQEAIDDAVSQLMEQMSYAPAEVKPLYLTAIHNTRNIRETKPSQQHQIAALKAIHEITGMKMEQQMMLAFAAAQFGPATAIAPATHTPERALLAGVEVLEEVEDDGPES